MAASLVILKILAHNRFAGSSENVVDPIQPMMPFCQKQTPFSQNLSSLNVNYFLYN